MTPLHLLTATQIAKAIRSGDTTCEAVTRACLARIAERDGEVQAWQYMDPDQAIAAARARDRDTRRGPLFGVPFNVKDIIDTSATEVQSRLASDGSEAAAGTPEQLGQTIAQEIETWRKLMQQTQLKLQ